MIDVLQGVLSRAGIDPAHLALEVSESAALTPSGPEFSVIEGIREIGVEVHLDNFGAGLSSLNLLMRCPLDALKIDRNVTKEIEKEEHATLVQSLVRLGHELGMKVVAEGVETEAQRELLSDIACDQVQGMIISKPLPANDFFSWMGSRQESQA